MSERPTILLVDDDPNRRQTIEIVARRAGMMRVYSAESESAARAHIITENNLDFAIVDIHLSPSTTEKEGLRVIAEIAKQHHSCVIICLNSSIDYEDGANAMMAGAHEYVSTQWQNVDWKYLLLNKLKLWKLVSDKRQKVK